MYVISEWFERYEVNDKGRPAAKGDVLRSGRLLFIRSKVHGHAQSAGFHAMQREAGDRAYEVFGVFQKFLEIAGDSGRGTRGLLLNHRGQPATIEDLSHILRVDKTVIIFAMQVLTDTNVAWMKEENGGTLPENPGIPGKSGSLTVIQYNTTQSNSKQNKANQDNPPSTLSNPQGVNPGTPGKSGNTPIPHSDDLFEQFWRAYPKKIAKEKVRECFEGLFVGPDLLQRMLGKIELLKETDEWKREGGRFIPHPLKWLERQGWEDVVPPGTEKGRKTPQQIVDEYNTERERSNQECLKRT